MRIGFELQDSLLKKPRNWVSIKSGFPCLTATRAINFTKTGFAEIERSRFSNRKRKFQFIAMLKTMHMALRTYPCNSFQFLTGRYGCTSIRLQGGPCLCPITHLFNDFNILTILCDDNLLKSFDPSRQLQIVSCRLWGVSSPPSISKQIIS